MRVAFFTESLPPNEDGVSKAVIKLSNYLFQQDIKCRFVSPFKPGEDHYLSSKVKQISYIPFPAYSQYRLSLPIFNGISKYFDDFDPDIIHVTSPTFLGLYALWYARLRNIPLVNTYHTHFVSYMKYYGLQRFESWGWKYIKWFYNNSDVIHVPTKMIQKELEDHGIENVEYIPHGIDTGLFTPEKKNRELREVFDNDSPIILYVGRFVKEKDLDDIIRVNKELNRRNCDFNMVLVGEGPMEDELRKSLPTAYFTGHLSGRKLYEWFATADIFAYPSTTETFGLVVQEAFSSGLPVVGVAKGGVKSLINDNKNGLLYAPHHIKEFADGLQNLLENEKLRNKMGRTARKFAQNNDWKEVNKQVVESYGKIISEYQN